MKSTLKRKILSAAIAITIVFQTVSPVIFATENLPIEIAQEPANLETTCPHHVHDENCGFRQEAPCSHLHDDSCYQEITKCFHQHSEVCYPVLDGDTLTDDDPQEPTVGHSKNMDTFGVYGHEVNGELEKTATELSKLFDGILKAEDD